MYQSGWENDVAAPVSYGPYSQMALTWNSAPIAVITPATRNSSPVDLMANPGHTRTPMTLRSVRPGPVNWVCFWRHTSARCTASRATMSGRDEQDVHRVEPADDVGAGPLAAEDQVRQALADERQGEDDGVGDAQPGARQQVVGQRVAGEPGGEGEEQQQHADDPVDLAWPAEGAGEEHPRHVQGDRPDEHERRPVVHLADQQPALDVEGDAHHRVERRRHLGAPQRLVRTLVDELLLRPLEEQRQVRAGDQQDEEAVQGDLAPQEREVVREHLVQHLADERLAADPVGRPTIDVPLDEPAAVGAGRRSCFVPGDGADDAVERRAGDEVAVVVDVEGELGQRARRRSAGRTGASVGSNIDWWHGHTSWRSVSGVAVVDAEQPDRAAGVGADLGVGDPAVDGAAPRPSAR